MFGNAQLENKLDSEDLVKCGQFLALESIGAQSSAEEILAELGNYYKAGDETFPEHQLRCGAVSSHRRSF